MYSGKWGQKSFLEMFQGIKNKVLFTKELNQNNWYFLAYRGISFGGPFDVGGIRWSIEIAELWLKITLEILNILLLFAKQRKYSYLFWPYSAFKCIYPTIFVIQWKKKTKLTILIMGPQKFPTHPIV